MMNVEFYRLFWACWIFGIVLSGFSFIISMNPNDWYMWYVGWFFVAISIIGSVGVKKHKKVVLG